MAQIQRGRAPTLGRQVFEAHLQEAKRVVDRSGVAGLRRIYERAKVDLAERLRSIGKPSDKVGPLTLHAMQAQVEAVLARLGSDFGKHLQDTGKLASELGAKHAVREFSILEKRFSGTTPVLRLEQPSVLMGMIDGVDSSLLRRRSLVIGTWSAGAVQGMEHQLAGAAAIGEPMEDTIRKMMSEQGIVERERYKAERITRTEMSYSMNATKHEALVRVRDELGDDQLRKKLIETLDDDRPGDDSFLIHGQVARLDRPFVYMRRTRGGGYAREEYMHPPNRPNDRAVVIPWSLEWEETDLERPLTIGELRAAPPTFWRKKPGVKIPPGHVPGVPYGERPVRKVKKEETPPVEEAVDARDDETEEIEAPAQAAEARAPAQREIKVHEGWEAPARDLFGEDVTPADVAGLTGFDGATVSIRGTHIKSGGETHAALDLYAELRDEAGQMIASATRTIQRDAEGKIYAYNSLFEVSEEAQGSGVGTEIFARQVEQARRMGVAKIKAECARSGYFNGYYTWARLGYDGPLREDHAEQTGLSRVSDLMKTETGRAWWKENGDSFKGDFDTSAESESTKTLEAYRRERASRSAKPKKRGRGSGKP